MEGRTKYQLAVHAGGAATVSAAAACRRRRCRQPPGPLTRGHTALPLQAEAIPRALEGRDIVARARTGSGKTLAYLLPALHRVLSAGKGRAGWQALVLVPTRELCEQVRLLCDRSSSSTAAACT